MSNEEKKAEAGSKETVYTNCDVKHNTPLDVYCGKCDRAKGHPDAGHRCSTCKSWF